MTIMIDLGQITAMDEAGNEFIKNVRIYQINDSWIIHIGIFASYYLSGEYGLVNNNKEYGDEQRFYLDSMGQNHSGWGVFITIPQLKELLEKAIKEIEERKDIMKMPTGTLRILASQQIDEDDGSVSFIVDRERNAPLSRVYDHHKPAILHFDKVPKDWHWPYTEENFSCGWVPWEAVEWLEEKSDV